LKSQNQFLINEKEVMNSKLGVIEEELSILKKDHERWLSQMNFFSGLYRKLKENKFSKELSISILKKDLETIFNEGTHSPLFSAKNDEQTSNRLTYGSKINKNN
jgi:hypothetical protein